MEMLEPSEYKVGQDRQGFVQNFDLRKARQKRAEEDREFGSGEVMSDAVMYPGTEGHCGGNIGASQIQPLGGGENLGIHVCGQYPKKRDVPLFDLLTAEFEVFGRDSRL